MSLHLHAAKGKYWELRRNVYRDGATRTEYLCYLGTQPRISRDKAEQICEGHGIELDQLRRVNRLQIVEADDAEGPPHDDAPSTVGLPAPDPVSGEVYALLTQSADRKGKSLQRLESNILTAAAMQLKRDGEIWMLDDG